MPDPDAGLEDDEPVAMTMNERTVWAYLVTVVLTSGTYLAVVAGRLLHQPVAEVSWVVPMLWTIGASVAGTVLLTIAGAVAGAVAMAAAKRARPTDVEMETAFATDVRDKEIDRRGGRALVAVLGAGTAGALALAMLHTDTFWIGNLLFVCGTVGAIVETTTKLRLYRRGF